MAAALFISSSWWKDLLVNTQTKDLRRGTLITIAIAIALVVFTVLSFTWGQYALSLDDTIGIISHYLFGTEETYPHRSETVFLQVRTPRLMCCIFAGAALSVAGAVYQGIFKNPMVSPDLLGASSGSALGACIGILMGFSFYSMHIMAFIMGMAAVALTYTVSSAVSRGQNVTMTLILTGMVVNAMFNAGVSITKSLADPEKQLADITFWLMGSMAKLGFGSLPVLIVPIVIGIIPILLLRYRLNIMSFGEEEAKTMGVDVRKLRIIFIVCSTLVTSAATATCGIIGWIGLVIPHLLRMLVGPDYRVLIPASICGGALFLLLVDNITRLLFTVEVSIGILTALVGAPFFLILLFRGRKGWV